MRPRGSSSVPQNVTGYINAARREGVGPPIAGATRREPSPFATGPRRSISLRHRFPRFSAGESSCARKPPIAFFSIAAFSSAWLVGPSRRPSAQHPPQPDHRYRVRTSTAILSPRSFEASMWRRARGEVPHPRLRLAQRSGARCSKCSRAMSGGVDGLVVVRPRRRPLVARPLARHNELTGALLNTGRDDAAATSPSTKLGGARDDDPPPSRS